MKAIIYDFDGVLVDSVEIKQLAFFKLFQAEGDRVAKLAYDYHLADNRNRFEVVNYMAAYLGKYEDYIERKLREFKDLVIGDIVSAREIPGSAEFIKATSDAGIMQFIVSGTPDKELLEIVEKRGWLDYFKETYGTPTKKPHHIKTILDKHDLSPSDVLFVGDMESDYVASHPLGLHFLGRSDDLSFPVDNVPVVKDFNGLDINQVLRLVREHGNS